MDLTYKELSKRDVINVADGRCLGRIVNATFSFPQGLLTGIFVPARKNKGFFWFMDKSTLFISVNKIIKIGGDVILVDIKCGDNCLPTTTVDNKQSAPNRPKKPCNPPCPPPCSPSPCGACPPKSNCDTTIDLSGIFEEGRIDLDDY